MLPARVASICGGLMPLHVRGAQVRYMYVPLGGARRRALVVWPIFFFVALWHDLEVRRAAQLPKLQAMRRPTA